MVARSLHIQQLWSGGLITNYYCSSHCAHCLYACHPAREKKYIDEATTEANLKKIRQLDCHTVHIGGGEPLLNPNRLLSVLQVAQREHVAIEYIETNSSWFKDRAAADELLRRLLEHEVSTLLISISPFHNENILFYKVKGVIEACHRTGMSVFPWIYEFYDEIDAFDDRRMHTLSEYEQRFGANYIPDAARRYYLAIRGRAISLMAPYTSGKSVETILDTYASGCHELADVSHFHLDPYGNYIPGLCAGLAIHRDDLGQPIDSRTYPFLSVLYADGIRGLLKLAQTEFHYLPRESYISKCDLCQDIRQFLVTKKGVRSPDLQPVNFYQFI